MSNIYSEAIAEAKKLKEIAEQNAKNKIIESITPRIRKLIEAELIGEGEDLELEPTSDDMDVPVDSEPIGEELSPAMDSEFDTSEDLSMDTMYEEPLHEPMDDLELVEPIEPLELESEIDLPGESGKDKNVNINITVESRRSRKTNLIRKKAIGLVLKLKEAKTRKEKTLILKELSQLRKKLGTKTIVERSLNKEILEVIKESTMSRRTRRSANRLRRNSRSRLFEGEDLDLDMEEEEGEEELDVEAIKSAVEELAAEVGLEVGEGEEEEEEDLDLEDEEGEEEGEEDFELEEYDELEEYGHQMEGEEKEEEELDEADDLDESDDEIVEINEASLRRALRSMQNKTRRPRRRRIQETRRRRRPVSRRRRRRIYEGDARKAASSFGGGKLGKEMFVEVDEDTLLNALAEELGGAHKMQINKEKKEGGAAKMVKHFGGGSAKGEVVKEARRRVNLAERKVIQARRKAQAAQKELKESNLFNAKLLYVNKLMQQHDLNSKQQRAIVEALDNAKTLREAKLLYTSLTDSLRRRNTTTRRTTSSRLNESLVRSGSGSNSTRSSAPAKSGVELDRWAILAGIKK